MNNQTFRLTVFYFTIMLSLQAEAVQNVYEYKNSEGVTEFTDEAKVNQEPEQQFQIQKMTEEEKTQSQQKLEQIREQDKALDKRQARQRQLENEQRLRQQEQQAAQRNERNSDNDNDDNDNYDGGYYRRPGLRPDRPLRPKPGLKPGLKPELKPGHPVHRPAALPGRR